MHAQRMPREREAQEEVPVLVHLQRLVEAAGVHDGRATQHHGDGMGEVPEQEAPADVALLARPALVRERRAVAVDHVPAGVDQSDVGPRVEHRHLPRQLAGPEAIVGVEQRDVFAARRSQAGVARGRRPAVILAAGLGRGRRSAPAPRTCRRWSRRRRPAPRARRRPARARCRAPAPGSARRCSRARRR